MGNKYNCFTTTGSNLEDSESRREIITGCFILHPDSKEEIKSIQVLWDTGATKSLISEQLARSLNLKNGLDVKLNIAETNEIGVEKKTSIAKIIFPGTPEYFHFDNISMIEMPNNTRYDAILGMDIINQGDFAVSQHEGQTIVSFRYPSQGAVMFQ